MQSSSKSMSSFAEDCEESGGTPFIAANEAEVKEEEEVVVATPKNKSLVDAAVMIDNGTVDTADLTTTSSAVVKDEGCEGAAKKSDSPGEIREAPSSLSRTSSLSNSPTDEHHQDGAPSRLSLGNNDDVAVAIHEDHEYTPPPPQGLVPYHRRAIMMQHPNLPPPMHSQAPHHRSPYHPSHYGALPTHPPPHLHPSRLTGAEGPGGGVYAAAEGSDETSPSASTISTKASLVVPNRFFKDYVPASPSRHHAPSDRRSAAPRSKNREGGIYEASPHRMMHARHLLSLSSDINNDQFQQSIPNHHKRERLSHMRAGSNDYSVDGRFRGGEESEREEGTSPTPLRNERSPTVTLNDCVMTRPLAADGIITSESPAAASTEASSSHSQQSLELGAMQSWETAGKPLAGWSVCSGNHSFSGIVEGLKDGAFTSAFSFSESSDPIKENSGKNKDRMLGVDKEDDDPSPKSILSKSGEKRKIAPGTHVQFSKDHCDEGLDIAWTESRKRRRGKVAARSSLSAPPPSQHFHDDYYHEDDPPRYAASLYDQYRHPPPPHPSHRLPRYTEEDPYYEYYYGPPPPSHSPYAYPPHLRKHPNKPHYRLEYLPPQPYHHAMPSQRPYPSGGGSGNIYTVHTPPVHTTSQTSSIHHHQPVNAQFSHNSIAPVASRMYSKDQPFDGWSKDDDDALMDLMRKVKSPKSWVPIAKKFDRGKSEWEIQDRWTRYLKPGSRKGQWTDEEDAVVIETVQNSMEEPFTRWSDLAQRLPGRVGKQVRDRWVNHLNPAINHLPFSREDVST